MNPHSRFSRVLGLGCWAPPPCGPDPGLIQGQAQPKSHAHGWVTFGPGIPPTSPANLWSPQFSSPPKGDGIRVCSRWPNTPSGSRFGEAPCRRGGQGGPRPHRRGGHAAQHGVPGRHLRVHHGAPWADRAARSPPKRCPAVWEGPAVLRTHPSTPVLGHRPWCCPLPHSLCCLAKHLQSLQAGPPPSRRWDESRRFSSFQSGGAPLAATFGSGWPFHGGLGRRLA